MLCNIKIHFSKISYHHLLPKRRTFAATTVRGPRSVHTAAERALLWLSAVSGNAPQPRARPLSEWRGLDGQNHKEGLHSAVLRSPSSVQRSVGDCDVIAGGEELREVLEKGAPGPLTAGVPLGRVTSHVSVFTDASLSGWGGMCQSQVVGGQWRTPPSLHINCLELATVLKVLKHFSPLLNMWWCGRTTPRPPPTSTDLLETAGGS